MKKLKVVLTRLLNMYLRLFPIIFQMLDYGLLQKDWNVLGISATAIAMAVFITAMLIYQYLQDNTDKKKGSDYMHDQHDFIRTEVI